MANQGCPGEGADRRTLGWLVCPLQRLLSWKSDQPPKLHDHGLWAWCLWPPYFVLNRPRHVEIRIVRGVWWVVTSWRMLRAGWRYDNQWKGYIGPSAAFKKVSEPLLFY